MDTCSVKCIDHKKVDQTLKKLPTVDEITGAANLFKALSDPSRLRIVLALLEEEHCVCDIAVICDQTDSAVSHQLRRLRTQGIVKNRRQGKIVYYTIHDRRAADLVRMILNRQVEENK